jgi:hypothetical protein
MAFRLDSSGKSAKRYHDHRHSSTVVVTKLVTLATFEWHVVAGSEEIQGSNGR